jgi:hypothetical protein
MSHPLSGFNMIDGSGASICERALALDKDRALRDSLARSFGQFGIDGMTRTMRSGLDCLLAESVPA